MNDVDSTELKHLLESIRFTYGYDFTDYSEASVKRRIALYMNNKKMASFSDFSMAILKEEKTFEEFVQELSVTVTEMFRDPLFYKSLREHVMKRLATYPFIKIWVAGCATGEEVYSIAILLKEANLLDRSVIYATDINQHSLMVAKEGLFSIDRMKEYTSNYQKSGGKESFSDYYMSKYNSVLFDKSLRKNMVFSSHNLAGDKSFNEFQLILCRNVLIYFNQQLQNRVINLFHESLCPFGILALGNKESLLFSDKKDSFDDIDRKEKIFIKIK
ncbi:MAG TPA: protein-glutamate O-methyltransferase CheR [Cytophagaceae bacterium]|jgi:chemotaxis protein methyltransferase CheR|nr:protein-glutamate O-methyltransferase CheR [Cytophagaceae bacterium]